MIFSKIRNFALLSATILVVGSIPIATLAEENLGASTIGNDMPPMEDEHAEEMEHDMPPFDEDEHVEDEEETKELAKHNNFYYHQLIRQPDLYANGEVTPAQYLAPKNGDIILSGSVVNPSYDWDTENGGLADGLVNGGYLRYLISYNGVTNDTAVEYGSFSVPTTRKLRAGEILFGEEGTGILHNAESHNAAIIADYEQMTGHPITAEERAQLEADGSFRTAEEFGEPYTSPLAIFNSALVVAPVTVIVRYVDTSGNLLAEERLESPVGTYGVKYDQDTFDLASAEVYNDGTGLLYGESWKTEAKQFNDYELVSDSGNTSGIVDDTIGGIVTVTYTYRKSSPLVPKSEPVNPPVNPQEPQKLTPQDPQESTIPEISQETPSIPAPHTLDKEMTEQPTVQRVVRPQEGLPRTGSKTSVFTQLVGLFFLILGLKLGIRKSKAGDQYVSEDDR